ncbi:MAG: choice-of-anchor Q domain-containing protein, partial [Kiritimatiellia bacterium]|nr:choice-of-anchor Q domain-containing protein [Kiritimatiellia bacterium]
LYNCTLISNSVANLGGGVSGGTLYNCTLISNRTTSTGGGAYLGTLYNCTLIGNYAAVSGGGTRESTLYNCTVVNNSADPGGTGGALNGTLYNTILYFNTSGSESNYSGTICFTNSCTAPTKAGWAANNITNVPVFMNTNTSNYRLSSDSPCINTGTNFSWMTDDSITSKDLDGRMRIRYGTVDMGAYEHTHAGTIYGFH